MSSLSVRGTPAPSEAGKIRPSPRSIYDPIITSNNEENDNDTEINFKVAKPNFYYRDRDKLDD